MTDRRGERAMRGMPVLALALGLSVATSGAAVADDTRADAASGSAATSEVSVEPAPPDALGRLAAERVASMSVQEKAASVVMGHVPGTDSSILGAYMSQTGIGGFILMGANIPADEAALAQVTTALTTDPAFPPLIAVDQEGGDVSRLPWDRLPAALTLKNAPAADTAAAFAARAALLQRVGIGVNFGIVADVAPAPGEFIFRRALGTDAGGAAERVGAAVAGESGGALSTIKHFPGHGAAPGDSHATIPTTSMPKAEWTAADARPFAAGIDAGAELLMFGHLSYTAVDPLPASLSAEWHRIAREELGFDGIAITDDLGMLQAVGDPAYLDPVANSVAALRAGNDMVLTVVSSTAETAPAVVAGIVAAVESGQLSEDRLDEAATRVAEARLLLAAEGRGMSPCASCEPAG
ncbi:glycoside hydrolase family 3 N-terminal domain-containing protein [Microbacterium invictum]|uniref:Glycoside hydrolase family 3 N-terminal domain-containing protein n=1 Tax=Microbacterium invictum TaxID=515415 RepID=A0ABZ0V5L4_9MICO|nr:glycoside hydrolase family 3 N-terminal domain-containing protein [Microbacterium invictum]WQB68858.1 glycoside hydrolase family 3 N-terminal domain-containing protein [Microbacterium invictum]